MVKLYWDTPYAIALALIEQYPQLNPEEVGLHELAHLVESLPTFADDPAVVTEQILQNIHITWYEEITHV